MRVIDLLFDSNFFQSFLCDGKSIFSQLYWLIKDLIFIALSGLLLMLWQFNAVTVDMYSRQELQSVHLKLLTHSERLSTRFDNQLHINLKLSTSATVEISDC